MCACANSPSVEVRGQFVGVVLSFHHLVPGVGLRSSDLKSLYLLTCLGSPVVKVEVVL